MTERVARLKQRSYETQANVKNLSGEGVLLRQGRFQLDNMQPGETRPDPGPAEGQAGSAVAAFGSRRIGQRWRRAFPRSMSSEVSNFRSGPADRSS